MRLRPAAVRAGAVAAVVVVGVLPVLVGQGAEVPVRLPVVQVAAGRKWQYVTEGNYRQKG